MRVVSRDDLLQERRYRFDIGCRQGRPDGARRQTAGPVMTSAISIGECMVELRPVEDGHLRRSFAGDAYNTAVYLKRSAPDIDVAFLTATAEVGDDVDPARLHPRENRR